MAEKLAKSYHLSHKLSQSSVDALFPSSITLLPPDIARQIEQDSQKAPAAGDDRYAVFCLRSVKYSDTTRVVFIPPYSMVGIYSLLLCVCVRLRISQWRKKVAA